MTVFDAKHTGFAKQYCYYVKSYYRKSFFLKNSDCVFKFTRTEIPTVHAKNFSISCRELISAIFCPYLLAMATALTPVKFYILHCVSKKNIPDVFSYNSKKNCWIFIIFGRNVTEKARNQKMLWRTCRHQPRSEQRTSLHAASVAAAAASYSPFRTELLN